MVHKSQNTIHKLSTPKEITSCCKETCTKKIKGQGKELLVTPWEYRRESMMFNWWSIWNRRNLFVFDGASHDVQMSWPRPLKEMRLWSLAGAKGITLLTVSLLGSDQTLLCVLVVALPSFLVRLPLLCFKKGSVWERELWVSGLVLFFFLCVGGWGSLHPFFIICMD
jgi:hypothetical protein